MKNVLTSLSSSRAVDLTHAFSPSSPVPDGLPALEITPMYDGSVQVFAHVGQFGTHLDAPGHFHKGMRLVDDIPAEEFLLEGCTIDISAAAARDPDVQLSREDVLAWEAVHGPVPEKSILILQTGWSRRWHDSAAFFNRDTSGRCHYPGWGLTAVEYLIRERHIRAVAHETPDTDSGATCGLDKGWPVESYVLGQDCWQIENLNIPEILPPRGIAVFVGVPKGMDATGFPCRVIAFVPA
jgi:kynurenine formamidase